MKKRLSLDQLKVKSFITNIEESEKVKSGNSVPLTGDLCHDTKQGCQSNPCTDTRELTKRCAVGTLDCVHTVKCNSSLDLVECWL